MRWFLVMFASAWSLLAGCSSQHEAPGDPAPPEGRDAPAVVAPAEPPKEVVVFRARYYRTKGPCVRIGDALAMPVVDGFEVTEVVGGQLKATRIEVRPFSGGGPAYPKELTDGKVYLLRLTPSDKTKQELREMEKEDGHFVWIDADEIEEHVPGRT